MLFAGRVLLMLGKVQFELQKLVDSYVSDYSNTVNCSLAFHIHFEPGIDLSFLYFSVHTYSSQSQTRQNLFSMNSGQLRFVLDDSIFLAYILDLSTFLLYSGAIKLLL